LVSAALPPAVRKGFEAVKKLTEEQRQLVPQSGTRTQEIAKQTKEFFFASLSSPFRRHTNNRLPQSAALRLSEPTVPVGRRAALCGSQVYETCERIYEMAADGRVGRPE
jgi:hypothetical protein